MYCPIARCCRAHRDSELQELKDHMTLIVHLFAMKNVFNSHMRSEGASSVGRETGPSEDAIQIFSIAPLVTSNSTHARISRNKHKERVKTTCSESRTAEAREKVQNAKRTASCTAPASADDSTLAQLFLAQTLARAGMVNDAATFSAITASVGPEGLLNSPSPRLRQVAQQPRHSGNPRRWPQFQREFKLWAKTEKLEEDQFLTALLDCLEGPSTNSWLQT